MIAKKFLLVIVSGLLIWNSDAMAQAGPESGIEAADRPGTRRPDLPDYQPSEPLPGVLLPPVKPQVKEKTDLPSAERIFVREFRFIGNTVCSDEELSDVAAPFCNRDISFEDMEELRHRLTLHYVEKGYVNSGAVIPDQEIKNQTVVFLIMEGYLSDIRVKDNEKLRSRYIRSRLALGAGPPLNIRNLEERVQLLHQDPLIRRVDAELGPGIRLGQSILTVSVKEENPYRLGFEFANNKSPSIGALRGVIFAEHRNLSGWGDTLGIRYGLTEGLDDISVYYSIPLTARETVLKLGYDRSDSAVVEEPFDDADIESEAETYSISLSRPFFKTPAQEFSLSLTGERRHSETFMMGRAYSFSAGVQDGESDIAVIRLSQDWISRSQTQVFAARSVFSKGIDMTGATRNESKPDGRFLTWLFQFQWARRLELIRGSQMIFRTDLQLSHDPLLPLEKFSAGGGTSVRGYRENQLVRDSGMVSSLEFRIPLFRVPVPKISKTPEDGMLVLAPFADWGWAENVRAETPDPRTIYSAGAGIRWDPGAKIHAQIYWGIPLRDADNPDNDLQDSGVHFQVSCEFF